MEDDDKVFVVVEDDHDAYFGEPPLSWRIRNCSNLLKCLSRCTAAAHNEMDPTIFVGITYSFIFGVMFGDGGTGASAPHCGALIYHFKKAPLAGIIASAGVFSTIFGFLFGSIFDLRTYCLPCGYGPSTI